MSQAAVLESNRFRSSLLGICSADTGVAFRHLQAGLGVSDQLHVAYVHMLPDDVCRIQLTDNCCIAYQH